MALYDAFVSYSHAKDKPIAAAPQSVVQTTKIVVNLPVKDVERPMGDFEMLGFQAARRAYG